MRVVHVSFRSGKGGASGAAFRLHKRLADAGVDSHFYSSNSTGVDDREHGPRTAVDRALQARIVPRIERFIGARLRPHHDKHSINFFPSSVVRDVRRLRPDIVNLHWVGDGMLRPEALKGFGCPLVWTCHDLWPLLGAEHYFRDSEAFRIGYSSPDYERNSVNLNRWLWKRKLKSYKRVNIEVVCNSDWVRKCALQSELFRSQRIRTIHYAIDTELFRPRDRSKCREMFDVEAGSYMILFGADTLKNKRKGFDLLLEALKKIPESIGGRNVVPVVFGPSCGNDVRESAALRHVGYITDQQLLSHLYSAADVMVTPSRKEAFGLTCLEALSCGTPVVAFKTGGYLDQIKHMDNGWLAEEESVDSLREGISSVLLDEGLRIRMGEQALRTVRSRFTIEREVNGYESLYSELVEGL